MTDSLCFINEIVKLADIFWMTSFTPFFLGTSTPVRHLETLCRSRGHIIKYPIGTPKSYPRSHLNCPLLKELGIRDNRNILPYMSSIVRITNKIQLQLFDYMLRAFISFIMVNIFILVYIGASKYTTIVFSVTFLPTGIEGLTLMTPIEVKTASLICHPI